MAVVSFRLLSFLCCLLVIIIFISQASAQPQVFQFHYFCDKNNDRGNYTANSTYQTNLNTLLSTLTSNTEINYGFYNSSYGQDPDKVNAIGVCRGDIKQEECLSCLNYSRANLTQLCPNKKEAIGWYEDEKCMLRYSDRSIFGHMEIGPAYFAWNLNNSKEEDEFNKVVKNLLDRLRSRAVSGDSRKKYAAESAAGPDNQTIYGLAQCTPDLSGPDCYNCLNQSFADIPNCCNNKIGARIIRPSCNVRYETGFLFYDPTADSPFPSPLPSPSPSTLLSPPPTPATTTNNSSSEEKSNTSRTAIAIVPLLLLLFCSVLSVSI